MCTNLTNQIELLKPMQVQYILKANYYTKDTFQVINAAPQLCKCYRDFHLNLLSAVGNIMASCIVFIASDLHLLYSTLPFLPFTVFLKDIKIFLSHHRRLVQTLYQSQAQVYYLCTFQVLQLSLVKSKLHSHYELKLKRPQSYLCSLKPIHKN